MERAKVRPAEEGAHRALVSKPAASCRQAGWLSDAGAALSDRLTVSASSPVCVAFSGGGDSLALLHLTQAWGRRVGRRIVALTVDHGLNPQSAEWTAAAAAAAARIGAEWHGLVWSGEKPARGLPAAARAARHALLATAARDLGACVIAMGHTADDVAESALIRAQTPGHGRLRPWAPSPAWPQGRGVFLLRPLLAARRADLRVWLSANGEGWLEDPSNVDPRFARSRARAELAYSEAGPLDGAVSRGDLGVRELAAEVLATEVLATTDGRLIVSRQALAGAPVEAARRVASAALVCAGGGARPPRGESLTRLIEAIASGADVASTLCGARVAAIGAKDAVAFGRDPGERARGGLASVRLQAGARGVFDGRFDIEALSGPVRIAPLAGAMARLHPADRRRVLAMPAGARGALPVVIDAGGDMRLPAPLGEGPAAARSLVGLRFAAACGLVRREVELAASLGMAL